MLVLRRESREARFSASNTSPRSPAWRKVLTSNLPLGWAFLLQDKLLSHALILDLLTYGVFQCSLSPPPSLHRPITTQLHSPSTHTHTHIQKRHCRAEIPQVLANGIPRVLEPLRGSRDLIAPAGVRSSESVPFNQIQNEFSALFTSLSPGLSKGTRQLESHTCGSFRQV